MKKIFSVILILLVCSFSMAFFSGCDSNQYVLNVDLRNNNETFNVLTEEQKRDYDLRLKALEEVRGRILISIYENEEAYNVGERRKIVSLRDPKNPSADPVEKEYFDLNWALFNGASGDVNLSSPGRKTLRVSFMGAVGECEYTVVDPNDKT